MPVIVPRVGPQDRPQVGLVVDQHPVGTLETVPSVPARFRNLVTVSDLRRHGWAGPL